MQGWAASIISVLLINSETTDRIGCFIFTCLSLLTLSQRPEKEGKVDYLIRFHSDFASTV